MMTESKKCQTHATLGNKSAASLIIQLPSTSANRPHFTHNADNRPLDGDPSAACVQEPAMSGRPAGGQSASQPPSGASRLQEQSQAEQPNNGANLTASQRQQRQHHRISKHRYQRNGAHSAIEQLHAEQTPNHSTAIRGANAQPAESDHSSGSGTPPPNYHEIPGIVPSYHGRSSGPPPAYEDVVNPNAPPPSYQSLFGQVREARKRSNGLVDLLRQLFLVLIGTLGCTMIIGFLLLIPITMIFIGLFYMNECRAENIPSFLVIGGLVWIMKNVLNCYNQFKKDSTTINRPPPPRRRPIAVHNTTTMTTTASTTGAPSTLGAASSSAPQDSSPAGSARNSSAHQTNIIVPSDTLTHTQANTPSPNGSTTRSVPNTQQVRQPPMIGITSYKCESILNYFLIVWFLAGCIVVYRIYEPDYENPLSSSYCNRTVYLYAFWLMTSAFIIMAIILSCLCCLMASSLISCGQNR